jgi:preprotein translocase subunit SecY
MAAAMVATGLVQPNKIDEFTKMVKVDIKKDLAKEMDKSNNRIIRYGLIVMLLLIILSFIYTEQIKEPSAQRTANNFKKTAIAFFGSIQYWSRWKRCAKSNGYYCGSFNCKMVIS